MSLSDTLTALATAIRDLCGTTDKYTLDDMVKAIGGLKVQNLIDPGQTYDTSVDKQGMKAVTGLDIDGWNKLAGKTITLSFDLEWANYHQVAGSYNRMGMEWSLQFESYSRTWLGCWYTPQTSDGQEHVANTLNVPNDKVVSIDQGDFYNQVNPECTFRATNLKIVVN